MAAAMSIHCISIPPKMVPWTLVSPGSTTWAVSTREARGENGGRRRWAWGLHHRFG